MATSAFPSLRAHVADLVAIAARHVIGERELPQIVIERPKHARYGDYSCSVALQLAKTLRLKPRDIAASLVAALPASPYIARAEVAGAGFVNLFVLPEVKRSVVPHILDAGRAYGTSDRRRGSKVLLEFVSANPTGPLHVGHGRGAAYGASMGNVLDAVGYDVTREYYVNDAGRQMDILALSTWLRYLEIAGVKVDFPASGYRGDYVRSMAQDLFLKHGARFKRDGDVLAAGIDGEKDPEALLDRLIAIAKETLGDDYATIFSFALANQLADCRQDLDEFGVSFDRWYSERSLFDCGKVAAALEQLDRGGHLYRKDGATWFRSTSFGDEKDRVVQRENGQHTYFASDIAYHLDKIERGYDRLIDVWGADHHGYISRVKGALAASGADPNVLTISLVQFAVLYRAGAKVSMSTRAGEFVTLRELRLDVGKDAARFFYVLRKSDQHLDFDLDLAKSQSSDNPVYYVQYAHARVCSVHEQWDGEAAALATADLSPLTLDSEISLLALLIEYPEVVENSAAELAPHLIAFYLRELAAEFHSYYNSIRILTVDSAQTLARVALITAARQVLANGLALLGVAALEKM